MIFANLSFFASNDTNNKELQTGRHGKNNRGNTIATASMTVGRAFIGKNKFWNMAQRTS